MFYSGLAVEPIHDEGAGGAPAARDSIFQLAENATDADRSQEASSSARRTITMYRDGFVVDDGPYRRVDDAENADFLRSLAMGRTPRELANEGNVTVNLVDKRSQEYVETFRSFSGAGASLGTSSAAGNTDGVIDPSTLVPPPENDANKPTTSIQVKLLNGKKKVVKIHLDATVGVLASMLVQDAAGESFRLTTGFPPKPLTDMGATIADSGLQGAQVIMKKA